MGGVWMHYVGQPALVPPIYASLNQDTAWQIVPGNVLLPWDAGGGTFPIRVPLANAGPGFIDAAGRFWLYAQYRQIVSGVLTGTYGATYDFTTATAVPQWTVSGAPTGTGGIGSAVTDGSTGLYAIAPGPPAWMVRYPGTGSTATATTTSDTTWAHAWDQGTAPTLPFYANGVPAALWRQGGAFYAWVMGEYTASWTGGGHVFVASLWTCSGDPTSAGAWSFVQYLPHYDLTTGGSYWGNFEEQRLPWQMPVTLGTDVFFPTGMDIIEGAAGVPADRTVVWRMNSGGTVTSDLAVPMPATDDETWGGPLAVYGGELYWAQFTASRFANWTTDSGTLTLWRRRSGTWSAISSWTRPLYNTVWHPFIATMTAGPGGLWLLFDPADRFFTGSSDPAPTVIVWSAASNTWAAGAQISGGGGNSTPRIWTLP
jgi:hypothetical protein